jgi:putative ABC transport system permease protein
MAVEFGMAQRYDAVAGFVNERAVGGARELTHIDGILAVEPFRATGIRITRGTVSRTTAITGLEAGSTLYRLVDADGREYPIPSSGAVMTLGLANTLGVHVGDTVDVELLERGGQIRQIVIGGLFDAMIGPRVFMSRVSLNALLREGDVASGAHLAIATGRDQDVFASLKIQPAVAAGEFPRRDDQKHRRADAPEHGVRARADHKLGMCHCDGRRL